MKLNWSILLATGVFAGQAFGATYEASLLQCRDTTQTEVASLNATYENGALLRLQFKKYDNASVSQESLFPANAQLYDVLFNGACLEAKDGAANLCVNGANLKPDVTVSLVQGGFTATYSCRIVDAPEQPGINVVATDGEKTSLGGLYAHSVHAVLAHELASSIDWTAQDAKGLYVYPDQSSCIEQDKDLVTCSISYRYRHWFGELTASYSKLPDDGHGAIWQLNAYSFAGQN